MKTSSQGMSSTCRHVFHGSDNENIEVLQGSEFDVRSELGRAKAVGSQYAVRHVKISSYEDMTDQQALEVVRMYANEFRTDPATATIVKHTKQRADRKASHQHYHAYFPEVMSNGKILDSSFSKIREEKIARIAEIDFGHAPVVGKHNASVIKDLEKSGQKSYADTIRKNTPSLDPKEAPDSSYSEKQFRRSKVRGINLNEVRQTLKDLRISSESFGQMIEQLDDMGLHIKKGDKANTYIIVTHDKHILGSANRLFNMKKQEFSQQYEFHMNGQNTKREPVHGLQHVTSEAKKSPEKSAQSVSADSSANTRHDQTRPSEPRKPAPAPVIGGHVHADLAKDASQTTDAMSADEKMAVNSQNSDRIQARQTIQQALASQEEFHKKLAELEQKFMACWRHIKPEPFPDEKDRNPIIVREKHENRLRPLRNKYHEEKALWFNGSSTRKALSEFNDALKNLRYDFKNLDILNNDDHFNYSLNHMADLYVSGRERTRKEWAEDLSVQSYIKAKKDFSELFDYIKETQNTELLQTALTNPVYALQKMKDMKEFQQKQTATMYKNTGPAVRLSRDI
ncbi:hypothetical protein APA32_01710 [Acetobacter tropicalis]|nr:hypothetical protein [Acetobacter tropicalis]GAL96145.1 hypothetical protein APA32_01710 [Acetobacter tropicalis]